MRINSAIVPADNLVRIELLTHLAPLAHVAMGVQIREDLSEVVKKCALEMGFNVAVQDDAYGVYYFVRIELFE